MNTQRQDFNKVWNRSIKVYTAQTLRRLAGYGEVSVVYKIKDGQMDIPAGRLIPVSQWCARRGDNSFRDLFDAVSLPAYTLTNGSMDDEAAALQAASADARRAFQREDYKRMTRAIERMDEICRRARAERDVAMEAPVAIPNRSLASMANGRDG